MKVLVRRTNKHRTSLLSDWSSGSSLLPEGLRQKHISNSLHLTAVLETLHFDGAILSSPVATVIPYLLIGSMNGSVLRQHS